MSKVRINDLAKELEVKSRAILDVLPELGVAAGKTHSSSIESEEADKVRAHFAQEARHASHAGAAPARHAEQAIVPKIDLSHISKPGDVLKAVLAKKHEEEEEQRHVRVPVKPARRSLPDPCPAGCRASCRQATGCRSGPPGTAKDRATAALRSAHRCPSYRSSSHCEPSALGRRGCQGSGGRGSWGAHGRCGRAARWGGRETACGRSCA